MSKAILNFANTNNNSMVMISNCQLAVNVLAECEREEKKAREEAKKKGLSGEALQEAIKTEKSATKEARERANTMCEAFIVRHMGVDDLLGKDIDIYHFDMVAFLQNMGALSAGDADKKTVKKVTDVTDLVIDQVVHGKNGRKKCEDRFTLASPKSIKNNPIDFVLAIVYAGVEVLNAWEYAGGGVVVRNFDEK